MRTTRRIAVLLLSGLILVSTLALGVEAQAEPIQLGAQAQGWQGQSPAAISGQVNPTLTLEGRRTYQLTWTNLDGLPHSFVIVDAAGNPLLQTEIVSGQGATQTVEFSATEAMAGYLCSVHPSSIRGAIQATPRGRYSSPNNRVPTTSSSNPPGTGPPT